MRYLTVSEVWEIRRRLLEIGGSRAVRDWSSLESAVAQPQMAFGGQELYPTISDKACALGFSLIKNHPFVDGNKRIGHAAMEAFLGWNGYELAAEIDDGERIVLGVADGSVSRESFAVWILDHLVELTP